jgi:hypothetical protein
MKDLKTSTLEDLLDDLVYFGRESPDLDYIPDQIFDKIYDIKQEIIRRFEENQ